jgi:hypothetical protein
MGQLAERPCGQAVEMDFRGGQFVRAEFVFQADR